MPLLQSDMIDLIDSSDQEEVTSRSISRDTVAIQEASHDGTASSQDLNEEDYDVFEVDNVDQAGFEEGGSEAGELPFDDNDDINEKGSLKKRVKFKELLESMESSADLKRLYPTSILHPEQNEGFDERRLLRKLIKINPVTPQSEYAASDLDFEELKIRDFVIYRAIDHSKGFNGQLEYLHTVSSDVPAESFLLDGLICFDEETRRVVGLEISSASFGGLGDITMHTTEDHIWVQTYQSKIRNETWYQLAEPATEYQPYWKASVWVSNFSKHVFDYICEAASKDTQVALSDFSYRFWDRIKEWHGDDETFNIWHAHCGKVTDFRKHLIRHGAFIYGQAHKQASAGLYLLAEHPVWDDLALADRYDQRAASNGEKTILTENIGASFLESFSAWGSQKFNLLSITKMSPGVAAAREERRVLLGLPKSQPLSHNDQATRGRCHRKISKVELMLQEAAMSKQQTFLDAEALVGKVVVVWLDTTTGNKEFDYAWISERISPKKLHAVWLSLPSETMCGDPAYESTHTFYSVGNELFFTDLCTVITVAKIVGVFDAAVFGCESPNTSTIRLRQLYKRDERTFITARKDNLRCVCGQAKPFTLSGSSRPKTYGSLSQRVRKMKNASLFCGAGLLDFAFGQSGTVETVLAVDNAEKPVRSHMANTASGACDHRIKSVNYCLKKFLSGKEQLPQINSITAGCPCPGFSKINMHKYTAKGQRNCSMLAHTLSWIDLALPEYAVIENVPEMDFNPPRQGIANACSQAISCLVAMGYQVRKMVLKGSDYGNSTMRKRLFLVAAAPNCILPESPLPTYGEGPGLQPIRTLRQIFYRLPKVHNDTQVNLVHPDHVVIDRLKQNFHLKVGLRNLVGRIPKDSGMGLVQAYNRGLLSSLQKRWYIYHCTAEKKGKKSKTLRRIQADGLFRTIVTVISPMDARIGGHVIHYDEDRTVTLEELRLAQGIPDSFLLVGTIQEQVEQIGNGVAWQMAAALGQSLSDAWVETVREDSAPQTEKSEALEMTEQSSEFLRATSTLGDETADQKTAKSSCSVLKRSQSDESYATIIDGSSTPLVKHPALSSKTKLEIERELHGEDEDGDEDKDSLTDDPNHCSKSAAQTQRSTAPVTSPIDTIERYEISDNESLEQHPDGTINYRHHQRTVYTKTTKATNPQPRKVIITVEIPAPKKRQAPLPISKDDDDSDSSDKDVIFVSSRPVQRDDVQPRAAKRMRRS